MTREEMIAMVRLMREEFSAEHLMELSRLFAEAALHKDAPEGVLVRGAITINANRFEVRANGRLVELTATEFHLLNFLAQTPGRVYPREDIIAKLSGDVPITERAIDVQVVGLRRKLGECSVYVQTVRGIGYRFKDSNA